MVGMEPHRVRPTGRTMSVPARITAGLALGCAPALAPCDGTSARWQSAGSTPPAGKGDALMAKVTGPVEGGTGGPGCSEIFVPVCQKSFGR